jgi:uncharacterized oxidoreductase
MKLTGNTIFITGGGSGIGRALAEALHKRGNEIIISGRRKGHLEEVVKANPGMHYIELNIEDTTSIAKVAKKLIADYPKLNVLINNAGIMQADDLSGTVDDTMLVSTITTNLMGPIRMTSALIEHLKKQESSYVINVTSGLAFIPLAIAAVYSTTKAAMHSYSQSLRYKLKDSSVKVLELAPPWVKTELMGDNDDPRQMPLDEFIDETIKVLEGDDEEVLTERAKYLRNNAGPNEGAFVDQFNDQMLEPHKEGALSH